jgi:mono/diheme cytochrome c family protein
MKPAVGVGLLLAPLLLIAFGFAATAQERQRTAPQIFADSCVHCHDTGGWGTRALAERVPAGQAELLRRKDIPAAPTRIAVRRGIGSMPPLTPTDLTDEELDRLARWLEENN